MDIPQNIINKQIVPPPNSEFENGEPITVSWQDPNLPTGSPFVPCDYVVNFSDAQTYVVRINISLPPNTNDPNIMIFVRGNKTLETLGLGFQYNASFGLSGPGATQYLLNGNDVPPLDPPPGNGIHVLHGPATVLFYSKDFLFDDEFSIELRDNNNPNNTIPGTQKNFGTDIPFNLFPGGNQISRGTITWDLSGNTYIANYWMAQCVPYSTSSGESNLLQNILNNINCNPTAPQSVGCQKILNNFPYLNKNSRIPFFGNKPTVNTTKTFHWPNTTIHPCLSNGTRFFTFNQSDYGTIIFNRKYNIYIQQVFSGGYYYPTNNQDQSFLCQCNSTLNSINNNNIPASTGRMLGWSAIQRKTNFSNVNCQGKYEFRCNWIRPGRLINMQPEAGKPLPYKYMDEMGSLLAKNRLRSNMIQNASAAGKNTLVFISRPTNCSEPKKCGVAPICKLSTGNKNPNFINRY